MKAGAFGPKRGAQGTRENQELTERAVLGEASLSRGSWTPGLTPELPVRGSDP